MSTTTPAKLAAALGYDAPDPSWQFDEDRANVPIYLFGKDHWSTYAYVETRIVDYAGLLNHDHMRTDADRHPLMMGHKRTMARGAAQNNTRKHPTRLKARTAPDSDGKFGSVELPDHDDYDCLEDLVAAGLVEIAMPKADGEVYRDANGKVVRDVAGNTPIEPGFVTGLTEIDLMAKASRKLTPLGQQVAGELRAHKGSGGNFHSFVPSFLAARARETVDA